MMKMQIVEFNLTVDYDNQSNRLGALMSVFRSIGLVKDEEVRHQVSVSGVRAVRLAAIKFAPGDSTHLSTRQIEEHIAWAGYRPSIIAEIYEVGVSLSLGVQTHINRSFGHCIPMVAIGTRLIGAAKPERVGKTSLVSRRLRPEYLRDSRSVDSPREESFFVLHGVTDSGQAVFSYSANTETWSLNSFWFLAGL